MTMIAALIRILKVIGLMVVSAGLRERLRYDQ